MTGLWRHPDFMKLWVGQTISRMGSRVTGTALPLVGLLALGAGPAGMGLLTAVEAAPILFIGLLAGVWVDRLRRRPVMIAADLVRAVLLLSIPLAALLHRLGMAQLILVAALTGVFTIFFDVAYQSYLPTLVGPEGIVEGNSKLSISSSAAEMAGPSLAGVLVQAITAPGTVLLDALSFVASALCVALIQQREPAPVAHAERRGVWREIGDGLRLSLGTPLLRALVLWAGTSSFFGNFYATLYSLFAIRNLGLGPALLGITIAFGGVGELFGSLLVGRLTRRFGLGRTMIATVAITGLLELMVPLAPGPLAVSVAVLIAVQAVGDSGWAIVSVTETSVRQAVTPNRLLGRVGASTQFLVQGIGPFGALASGVLAQAIGPRATLAIAAIGMSLSALWLLVSPLRALRELPDHAANEPAMYTAQQR